MKFSTISALASLTSLVTAALPPINVTGNAFWNTETGDRFYIRGVDYQPGGSSNLTDPLGDESICKRDIEYFKELGINTIRVYSIDNEQSHDACMEALDDAGIYLILDVNTPKASISRASAKCSYNVKYLQNVFATIDEFAQYDNVLGFFAGNEVINDDKSTATATYVKATVRDMKKYLKARGFRAIPVGYSAADVDENRLQAAEYFNCGDDEDARIDMFGVNDYSWCGDSSFQQSGYKEKVTLYAGYSVPIFLSEFGCNEVPGSRPFTEIESIYSTDMSGVFSGGLVYEYSQEDNNYGLVDIDGDSVTKRDDFNNLAEQYNKTKNPEGNGGFNSQSSNYSECPDFEDGKWEANNTLPDMPSAASVFFESGAGKPLGTNAGDTQWACGDDDDFKFSSDSTTRSATTGGSQSSGSSGSSSSGSGSSASGSGSSESSSSRGSGSNLAIPTVFNIAYLILDNFGGICLLTFVLASVIAITV
ncbi:putative secreted protein [Wickerhamomyces ciferrii]|uniref:1,3-beta-glucanosyltransferase n=1 Tax=Wickerhamomyces ciferrii (strain ATCC 14091 / BCRC 22168 / CBS 111 / JCM 3599 / NBRC 0793 / NRRL Y-1031 F-60-10) TaxID=1206466 RepID=K0KFA4_WICCF|nr:uncharacterized protein BN7_441 [Wickerhamomyces ciferrii]CCH40907.1 putative secreted protein [Wickerhamomyces ciferrii]